MKWLCFSCVNATWYLGTCLLPETIDITSADIDKGIRKESKGQGQEHPLDFSANFESAQKELNFSMWASFYLRNIALIIKKKRKKECFFNYLLTQRVHQIIANK